VGGGGRYVRMCRKKLGTYFLPLNIHQTVYYECICAHDNNMYTLAQRTRLNVVGQYAKTSPWFDRNKEEYSETYTYTTET